ncbi:MAG TPA: hypothetical protein PKM73_19830 [Verrucomicrobiota bacterium]|nr:hypothetical protein [Verrucomicrobiota bacterium]HNU53177.1 hypothetical protein [Verrucomicrobiota bacterium]
MNESQPPGPACPEVSSEKAPPRPRSTPSQEAPFAWQAKAALRAITRGERVTNRCHALAIYVVLSLLLSDRESGEVTCTKGYLASLAGVGPRAVAQALLDLEALGLVQVQREKVPGTRANAVNTYRLTSCTKCTTSCTGSSPSRARNKNNKEGAPAPSLRRKRNRPPAAAAAYAHAPAAQPVAPERGTSAFLMNGLDA